MTPISFLGFRDELNPASGFQSMQFREIEFVSGLKHESVARAFADDEFARERLAYRLGSPSLADEFFALLRRHGFDAPAHDSASDGKERRSTPSKLTRAVREI